MIRRVVVSSTTGHDYCAFLPFVGLFWRRIGYEPVFFLVGTHDEWWQDKRTNVVMSALVRQELPYVFVDHIEGAEDATISQCIRQHAAAHDYFKGKDDDLLICSDADLIPFRREFYQSHDPSQYAIGLYYANAYEGETRPHWPACHYSMLVKTWREVMWLNDKPMMEALKRTFFDYGLAEKMAAKKRDPAREWGHVWYTDELMTSQRIAESKYANSLALINREGRPPQDRLDRACWPVEYDINKYTDCHSVRPIWSKSNWPKFRPILAQAFNAATMAWADEYREAFRDAMGCDQ